MPGLSHLDEEGRARMVDVGAKPPQRRTARARGFIRLSPQALELLRQNRLQKGDALAAAQLAGIMAAKRTASLIPLCHPLPLDFVDLRFQVAEDGLLALAEVRTVARTGVEMEALTAVAVALLTVYDMCKSVDPGMCITEISLLEKEKEDVR